MSTPADPLLRCDVFAPDALAAAAGKPALFIDRDGVLVDDPGFLHCAADVRLLPGAEQLVRLANARGWPAIVVTNQSGIGRGQFAWADYAAVMRRLGELLALDGARIDAALACGAAPGRPPHPSRKPRPGMLFEAADRFGVHLEQSWLVGDRLSDIRAARAAGLAGAVLVGARTAPRPARRPRRFALVGCADTAAAVIPALVQAA